MLLNLTNHPSSGWPENQRQDAINAFHEIEDWPFPIIPPDAQVSDIQRLANHYIEKIQHIHPQAVHVMGEMTFSFLLVSQLLRRGIPCIASTTQRITQQEGNTKVSTFEFVQFRPYVLASADV